MMQLLSPAYMMPDRVFEVLDKCPQLATRATIEVGAVPCVGHKLCVTGAEAAWRLGSGASAAPFRSGLW